MLIEELKSKDIILASRSPRRKQLLSALGINFRIVEPVISEDFPAELTGKNIALHLASKKAESVIKRETASNNLIVIASDTIVCINNLVLNKPFDRKGAIQMIRTLSDKWHNVITAVCISDIKKKRTFYSDTLVHFTKLQDDEIEYYVDNFKPYDKAGAYGIQEWIGFIGIEQIKGSYFNVMGLPVQKLYTELKRFIKE